jgi:HEAT repeat protein
MSPIRVILIAVLVVLALLVAITRFGGSGDSLGGVKAPQGVTAVSIDLRDGAVADPSAASSALGAAPAAAARPTLVNLALKKPKGYQDVFRGVIQTSQDPRVREAAVAAWRAAGDADSQVMIDLFQHDKDTEVRAQAAVTIAHQRDWDGTEALVAGLRDPDVRVREAAFAAITKVVGLRFDYKPTDPPAKREPAVRLYEQNLKYVKSYNEDYKRLLEIQKKKKERGE